MTNNSNAWSPAPPPTKRLRKARRVNCYPVAAGIAGALAGVGLAAAFLLLLLNGEIGRHSASRATPASPPSAIRPAVRPSMPTPAPPAPAETSPPRPAAASLADAAAGPPVPVEPVTAPAALFAPVAPALAGGGRISGGASMEQMFAYLSRRLDIEDTIVTPPQGFEQWGKVSFRGSESKIRERLDSSAEGIDRLFTAFQISGGAAGVVMVIRYDVSASSFAEPVYLRSGNHYAYGNFLFQGELDEMQQIRRVLGD